MELWQAPTGEKAAARTTQGSAPLLQQQELESSAFCALPACAPQQRRLCVLNLPMCVVSHHQNAAVAPGNSGARRSGAADARSSDGGGSASPPGSDVVAGQESRKILFDRFQEDAAHVAEALHEVKAGAAAAAGVSGGHLAKAAVAGGDPDMLVRLARGIFAFGRAWASFVVRNPPAVWSPSVTWFLGCLAEECMCGADCLATSLRCPQALAPIVEAAEHDHSPDGAAENMEDDGAVKDPEFDTRRYRSILRLLNSPRMRAAIDRLKTRTRILLLACRCGSHAPPRLISCGGRWQPCCSFFLLILPQGFTRRCALSCAPADCSRRSATYVAGIVVINMLIRQVRRVAMGFEISARRSMQQTARASFVEASNKPRRSIASAVWPPAFRSTCSTCRM